MKSGEMLEKAFLVKAGRARTWRQKAMKYIHTM